MLPDPPPTHPEPPPLPVEQRRRAGALPRVLAVATAAVLTGLAAFVATLLATSIGASSLKAAPLPRASAPTPTPAPLTDIARPMLPSVVTIEAERSTDEALGTGWLLDDHGDFVTNAHVVDGQLALRITDRHDHAHVGVLLGIDAAVDIAVVRCADGFQGTPLKVDRAPLTSVPIDVVALASSRATGQQDMTVESLTSLHQDVPLSGSESGTGGEPSVYHDMLQLTGARVFQGNSGGPVVDHAGAVVGILTLASPSGDEAYAIPLSRVIGEIEALSSKSG